ncbi:MAG TPA: glycosyltransferase [Pirellula sp.]|nr:glycosyltransferase [Pirellula sp.]
MKVAIIFDNERRPDTTGLYCRRALGQLCDVEHLLPAELEHVPDGMFDLFVTIDDSLNYEIPQRLRPTAAWAIDTHINLRRSLARFGGADWLFAAQKKGAKDLQQALGREVQWLPLACDPDMHHPFVGEVRRYDVGFIGHVVSNRRKSMLATIQQEFANHFIGQAFFEDMARLYSQFAVALNCSVAGDLNMRVFEALACGVALVTDADEENGLSELFEVERHLLSYRDQYSLVSQIRRLLSDTPFRQQVASEGRRYVISNHTYEHRMRSILDKCVSTSRSKSRPKKSSAYLEIDRKDVQSLMPTTARRILDIGCGAGRMGTALKGRQDCIVIGVELVRAAAEQASKHLDRVAEIAIEALSIDAFRPMEFDCIILNVLGFVSKVVTQSI